MSVRGGGGKGGIKLVKRKNVKFGNYMSVLPDDVKTDNLLKCLYITKFVKRVENNDGVHMNQTITKWKTAVSKTVSLKVPSEALGNALNMNIVVDFVNKFKKRNKTYTDVFISSVKDSKLYKPIILSKSYSGGEESSKLQSSQSVQSVNNSKNQNRVKNTVKPLRSAVSSEKMPKMPVCTIQLDHLQRFIINNTTYNKLLSLEGLINVTDNNLKTKLDKIIKAGYHWYTKTNRITQSLDKFYKLPLRDQKLYDLVYALHASDKLLAITGDHSSIVIQNEMSQKGGGQTLSMSAGMSDVEMPDAASLDSSSDGSFYSAVSRASDGSFVSYSPDSPDSPSSAAGVAKYRNEKPPDLDKNRHRRHLYFIIFQKLIIDGKVKKNFRAVVKIGNIEESFPYEMEARNYEKFAALHKSLQNDKTYAHNKQELKFFNNNITKYYSQGTIDEQGKMKMKIPGCTQNLDVNFFETAGFMGETTVLYAKKQYCTIRRKYCTIPNDKSTVLFAKKYANHYYFIMERDDFFETAEDTIKTIYEDRSLNKLDCYKKLIELLNVMNVCMKDAMLFYGFTHRDLKSDNVLIHTDKKTQKFTAKIFDLDFSGFCFALEELKRPNLKDRRPNIGLMFENWEPVTRYQLDIFNYKQTPMNLTKQTQIDLVYQMMAFDIWRNYCSMKRVFDGVIKNDAQINTTAYKKYLDEYANKNKTLQNDELGIKNYINMNEKVPITYEKLYVDIIATGTSEFPGDFSGPVKTIAKELQSVTISLGAV